MVGLVVTCLDFSARLSPKQTVIPLSEEASPDGQKLQL
jgi:hypothetical protein